MKEALPTLVSLRFNDCPHQGARYLTPETEMATVYDNIRPGTRPVPLELKALMIFSTRKKRSVSGLLKDGGRAETPGAIPQRWRQIGCDVSNLLQAV